MTVYCRYNAGLECMDLLYYMKKGVPVNMDTARVSSAGLMLAQQKINVPCLME